MTEALGRILAVTRQQWECEMVILSNDDLKALTGGLIQGAAQRRWIIKWLGFEPPMKIDGHPSITWEQVNRGKQADDSSRRINPRWSVAA